MKEKNGPFNQKVLLGWMAIISLTIPTTLYYFLKEQAAYDASLDQKRMLFLLVGIIISGICIIIGTAGRWFYPK